MSKSRSPDRRSVLFGRLADARRDSGVEIHIASLVVHVRPEAADAVARGLAAWLGVEIHAHDPIGKMVVTLEAASESEIAQRLGAIQNLPGVLSAALVFHHFESDTS
jgi:nitrate reductase NapD